MKLKNEILVVTDYSIAGLRSDPFQSQLFRALNYIGIGSANYFFLNPSKRSIQERTQNILRGNQKFKRQKFRKVVLIGRTRVFFRELEKIQRIVNDTEVVLYDQDPWESYIHNSRSRGFFPKLQSYVNLKEVHLTSKFWVDIVSNDISAKVIFSRMGMEPRLVPMSVASIDSRQTTIAFKGSIKEHRVASLNRLREMGVPIEISGGGLAHLDYLFYLQGIKAFFHDESGAWFCPDIASENKYVPRTSGMWIKDIEIASQGTFVIRNYGEDASSYSMSEVPLVRFFRDIDEVEGILEEIINLSTREKLEIQEESRSVIRSRNDWIKIAEALTE